MLINLCVAEAGIFRENQGINVANDALDPCVAKSSATDRIDIC